MLLQKMNLKMKRWINIKNKTKEKNIVKKKDRVLKKLLYKYLSEKENENEKEYRRNCHKILFQW